MIYIMSNKNNKKTRLICLTVLKYQIVCLELDILKEQGAIVALYVYWYTVYVLNYTFSSLVTAVEIPSLLKVMG